MKTMKTFIRIALGLSVILAVMTSCEDNLEFSRKVTFSAAGGYQNGPKTKTAYSDKDYPDGDTKYERIDWVEGDLLKIVSDVARTETGDAYADYEVVGVSGTASRISNAEVDNADDNGLNWGPGTNTFYALYPSPSTSGVQTGVNIVTTATGATFTGVIPQSQSVTLRDTIYQPNMKYAYMWAATATTATSSVDLAFQPAMTALEFTIGNPESGTLKIRQLKVFSNNRALCGTFTGNINKETRDVSYTCPTKTDDNNFITIDFASPLEIDSGDFKSVTVLALPQNLTQLTVVLTLDGGETRTLELKNSSNSWYSFNANKKYHIALGVPTSYDYVFEVTWNMPANLPIGEYNGASNDYTVTSYRTLRGSTVKQGAAWHAEFRERTYNTTSSQWGSWTDWSTTRPAWLYYFTDSRTGAQAGTGAKNYRAKTNAITGHNTHTDALKDKTPLGTQSSPYDLSTNGGSSSQTTANCYIVSAPGWYMLPLVYGNARKNGSDNTESYQNSLTGDYVLNTFKKHDNSNITGPNISGTSSAELVWQDAHNLVTNIGVYNTSYIRFYVDPEMISQGNAVIAAKNSSGTILWSWHIWVTDQSMTNVSLWGYNFMPVNLGWCDGGSITYGRREFQVRFIQDDGSTLTRGEFTTYQNRDGTGNITLLGNCTYYQWGRKDPMVPAKGTNTAVNDNKTFYLASGESKNTIDIAKINEFTPTIGWAIQHPSYLLLADSFGNDNEYIDWLRNTHYNNLWNTKSAQTGSNVTDKGKTVYDPCPPGYVVPPTGGIPKSGDTGYSLGTYSTGNNWYTKGGMHWPVVGNRLLLTTAVNPQAPDVNSGGQKITGYGNYDGGYGKLLLSTPNGFRTESTVMWCPPNSTTSDYVNTAKMYTGNGKATACPVRCVAE